MKKQTTECDIIDDEWYDWFNEVSK